MANRLAAETSPYLRQHADNPVDWYPWGDEAFLRARTEDKPILLSVGYSACHWCHVMAHESFEDPATADVVNAWFVNVKVDREERPDVDAIYMEAVTALTGRGGWPMTVFLTPEGRPFYGGTYYPPQRRGQLPSFLEVCNAIHEAWSSHRDDVDAQADQVTAALGQLAAAEAGELPDQALLTAAVAGIGDQFDPRWGGFGRAPKFPQAMSLDLLLRWAHQQGAPDALDMATTSLDAMASGGIYDHLGGGFSRYSVDQQWLVPHFEKMLYDQALLVRVYLHAWQVTGLATYRQVVDETVGYVLDDLGLPGGGFASAEDADSEGEEGRFYLWEPGQIRDAAGEHAEAAMAWWGVTAEGNFEGRSILHRPVRGDLLRPPAVETARRAMRAARDDRVRPALDDKVLTEWNALMTASLAEAAAATTTPSWARAAEHNAEFMLDHLRRPDGRWLRSWQADGGARHLALAADHAALVDAFTRLAELTGRARWLREAQSTAQALVDLFWDDARGGVFTTGADSETLVTRPKDLTDNALPSANAATAAALLRLGALTGEHRWRDRAEDILRILAPLVDTNPLFFAHGIAAAEGWVAGTTEIVVVGDRPDLVAEVHRRYLPDAVLGWGEPTGSPLWQGRSPGHAHVCEGFVCHRPVTTPEELAAQLDAR